jgi:hypothetical protein
LLSTEVVASENNKLPKTWPENIVIIFISIILSTLFFFFRRKTT